MYSICLALHSTPHIQADHINTAVQCTVDTHVQLYINTIERQRKHCLTSPVTSHAHQHQQRPHKSFTIWYVHTGWVSKNLTLRILTVKKHLKTDLKFIIIIHFKMFLFLTLFWLWDSCSWRCSKDDHFPIVTFVWQAFLYSVRIFLMHPVTEEVDDWRTATAWYRLDYCVQLYQSLPCAGGMLYDDCSPYIQKDIVRDCVSALFYFSRYNVPAVPGRARPCQARLCHEIGWAL